MEGLGFDKDWSEYYHNSRNIKNGMAASEYIVTNSETSTEFEYTLGDDICAVKQLRIIKCDDSYSEPATLEFNFRTPHFWGRIPTPLPPMAHWQVDGEGSEGDDLTGRTVLMINHRMNNYDCVADYKFKNVNMVLKNDIRAGHKLILQVKDANEQPITCLF